MAGLHQISVIVFIFLLALVILRDRKNLERKGLLLIRRTEKGKAIITGIARSSPYWWRKVGTLGVVLGFIGMSVGIYFVATPLYKTVVLGEEVREGPSLVLPTPFPSPSQIPGVLFVPFWFWIVAIASVVFIHEGMHAIQMSNEDIKIESSGLLLLAVIPGAFVEPDEEQLKSKGLMQRQRVYAAGSFGNFFLAGLFYLIIAYLVTPIFFIPAVGWAGYVQQEGNETLPAQQANMSGAILYIDDQRTERIADLQRIMGATSPGQAIEVRTTKGTYELTLAKDPNSERGYMGILLDSSYKSFPVMKDAYRGQKSGEAISFFVQLLSWIGILNFGIGIVNLLPLKPLDGGLMFEALMEKYFPSVKDTTVRGVSAVMLALLVGSLFAAFI